MAVMIAVIFFAIAIIMTFTHAFRIGCSAGQNARIKVCTLRPMQVQQDTVGWNREAIITTLDSVLEEKSGKSIIVCGLLKGVDTTDLKIKVELQFDEDTLDQRRGIIDACRTALTSIAPQEDISVTAAFIGTKVRNIIAVSSCKGGVGKSTVAVNLAYTLRGMGFATGILDADVFGPSLPTMTRASQRVLTGASNGRIAPWEYEGVRLMSLGFLNAGAAIMRGPMVNQVLTQMVQNCNWGELDYLVIDMPPGTGDIQLTLSQILNITAAVVVTTPQRLSFVDVVKGIDMLDIVNIPCVAVVENMAAISAYNFTDAFYHQLSEKVVERVTFGMAAESAVTEVTDTLRREIAAQRYPRRIFGAGHTRKLREMWGINTTVALPLLEEVSQAGDRGIPYVLAHPDSEFTEAMRTLAESVVHAIATLRHVPTPTLLFSQDRAAFFLENTGAPGKWEQELSPRDLRAACRCAACVEELTGRPLLDRTSIPASIRPILPPGMEEGAGPGEVQAGLPVGRYAVAVDWSDGHKSLYPYKQLASLLEGIAEQE